jgi:DNA-binding transcriptional MerR regulator
VTIDRPDPLAPPGGAIPEPPGLALTVSAVARRLGVAPATLRTWDRRYGLGPSQHPAGSHRRYSADDVARLERMRSLVFQGVAPADAAREALRLEDGAALEEVEAAQPTTLTSLGDLPPADAAPTRTGGGRIVALHGGSPQARGLARAALALDATAIRRIVATSLSERGTVWTWDHLLAPVLIGVGERFASTGQGVDLEHLLSEAMVDALRDVAVTAPERQAARPVLLAAAPEEQHTLPLHAVAAGLAERGVVTRMLGARLPADALHAAMSRSGAAAVMLWSHDPITGDPAVLRDLPVLRPAPIVLVGGPGWPERLPERVTRVADLSDAVQRLANAVHGLSE